MSLYVKGNTGKSKYLALVAIWILGLLLGALFSKASSGTSFDQIFAQLSKSSSTFPQLIIPVLFPFLLSALAVYIKHPGILYSIAFGKAFVMSYLGNGILAVFGSAGWLLRLLLMFCDCMCVPLLFWYWLRHVDPFSHSEFWDLWVAAACAILIGCCDSRVIAPFIYSLS